MPVRRLPTECSRESCDAAVVQPRFQLSQSICGTFDAGYEMAGSEVRTTYVEYDKTGKLAVTCGERTGGPRVAPHVVKNAAADDLQGPCRASIINACSCVA
jgi:hypothetical protein